jgi:hypothetical protein
MGWAFIIIGLMIAAAGFMLERKYHEEATATSFGMPHITIGGILNFLGVVLIVFGLCCFMVGVMVQFF